MKSSYRISVVAAFLLCVAWSGWSSANPLTNKDAVFAWTPTADANIRYELRWKNFTMTEWAVIATDLDSTTGRFPYTFPAPLPDTTGDRFICFDMRAKWKGNTDPATFSKWVSELDPNKVGCNQVPLAPAVPPPVPDGLQVVSATADQVVIVAAVAKCPRVTTSTKGSTATVLKRTITCVK